MKRRMLLQGLTLLPLLTAGTFAAASERARPPVLLLVELNGGNDSLNTVIPLTQLDAYRRLRPHLGLTQDERVALDAEFAMHRALSPLMPAWKAGELALVHGLGYPEPNRSHFRGIEIWDTASAADEYLEQGWLAKPARAISDAEIDALVIGRNPTACAGAGCQVLDINSLKAFLTQSGRFKQQLERSPNPALQTILDARYRIREGDRLLRQLERPGERLESDFPRTPFGRQLADVTRVIQADLGVPVFKVALGSFDTHRNQRPTHARLLKQLAEGLAALRTELQRSGHWDRIMVMTYSEFGRRAGENDSGGTDHGTAATHFVIGGRIRGGHHGRHPDLTSLVDRDMQFSTDFRCLYQTVLSDWWHRPDLRVPGGTWDTLKLIG